MLTEKVDYIITGLLYCAIENLKNTTPYVRVPEPDSLRYRCDEALADIAVHMRGFDGIALFKLKWRLLGEIYFRDEEDKVWVYDGKEWKV